MPHAYSLVCLFVFLASQEGTVVNFDSSSGAITIELSKESLKRARGILAFVISLSGNAFTLTSLFL